MNTIYLLPDIVSVILPSNLKAMSAKEKENTNLKTLGKIWLKHLVRYMANITSLIGQKSPN